MIEFTKICKICTKSVQTLLDFIILYGNISSSNTIEKYEEKYVCLHHEIKK
jgi:hypothetical protein